ncbi:MAG: hypothetical protein ABIP10_02835 [Ferruginibacter sp.]
MKKLHALIFCTIACIITASSCRRNNDNGNISLNFKESDHYYSLAAYFDKSQTRNVEQYMDSRIGKRSKTSFINSTIDGTITLDDHTTFYIKKAPGVLRIKLDKDKNSMEAYDRIRSMCEGIKKVLAK